MNINNKIFAFALCTMMAPMGSAKAADATIQQPESFESRRATLQNFLKGLKNSQNKPLTYATVQARLIDIYNKLKEFKALQETTDAYYQQYRADLERTLQDAQDAHQAHLARLQATERDEIEAAKQTCAKTRKRLNQKRSEVLSKRSSVSYEAPDYQEKVEEYDRMLQKITQQESSANAEHIEAKAAAQQKHLEEKSKAVKSLQDKKDALQKENDRLTERMLQSDTDRQSCDDIFVEMTSVVNQDLALGLLDAVYETEQANEAYQEDRQSAFEKSTAMPTSRSMAQYRSSKMGYFGAAHEEYSAEFSGPYARFSQVVRFNPETSLIELNDKALHALPEEVREFVLFTTAEYHMPLLQDFSQKVLEAKPKKVEFNEDGVFKIATACATCLFDRHNELNCKLHLSTDARSEAEARFEKAKKVAEEKAAQEATKPPVA